MTSVSKVRAIFKRRDTDNALELQPSAPALESSPEHASEPAIDEKTVAVDESARSSSNDGVAPQDRHDNLQHGVEAVEAVTLNWSKASLIAVFIKYVVPAVSLTVHSDVL